MTPNNLALPAPIKMTAALDVEGSGPFRSVQVDALVVMKIIQHGSHTFPAIATGQLLGLDSDGILQVTYSFPHVAEDPSVSSKLSEDMMKCLEEVNIDNNIVGWYQSAYLGSYLNTGLVETQFQYQQKVSDRTVVLVYDVSKSAQGALALKAFRLSQNFLAAQKEGKFTSESLRNHNLTYHDILQELPVEIHNSQLVKTLLLSLSPPDPFTPNFDALDINIDPYLEKNIEILNDTIDDYNYDQGNQQWYQRQLAREQTKIQQWQAKRKSENVARQLAGQPPLPEDEWQTLFRPPNEPSKLENILLSAQIDQYCKQIETHGAVSLTKLYCSQGLQETNSS
ncbi:Eukaryotic translation initiation factor 3 subunit H [Neolecta irregularis DAH-3]|uniref:Eukaryotic translation initiation factor 3 subunit H n=1 Tax=Neolecta irregularis (strain DAH-3) TaxID=1198029 RepID=A0A1U7LTJ3_NEOID|nr:Eukaryotic translation initiation factor 3 subunit H [Neolecta irregularis DAH-3]|eukprot:OLL25903.1 Eukaryotic translation initiation factor 3 subunit H [Neolecta irregularis DAH-3]